MKIITPTIRAHEFMATLQKSWYMSLPGIAARLTQLGLDATPETIIQAIGYSPWPEVKCNECGQKVDLVIEIGEPPDYETATAWVCPDCLKKAVTLCESEQ